MNVREYINAKKNELLLGRLTTDKFKSFFEKNQQPLQTMLTYYECANMQIETKFKVLNEEFSLSREYSPIETIKARIKTMDSLIEKVNRYDCPLTLEDIEDRIEDIS